MLLFEQPNKLMQVLEKSQIKEALPEEKSNKN